MKRYSSDGPSAADKALDLFAELMIDKIRNMKTDWHKPWVTSGTACPVNIYDHRPYDGLNQLMLSLHSEKEGYTIPVYGTFDRILGFNYSVDKDGVRHQRLDDDGNPLPQVCVKKGEKSFPVYFTSFTVVNKETKEKIKIDDWKKLSKEEQQNYRIYPKQTVWPVFCVEQTNLREARPEYYKSLEEKFAPKERPQATDNYSFPPMDRMIADNLWVCPIIPQYQNRAYYSPSSDSIVLPEKRQFSTGEAFYGTAFHEMVHSTGASSRLDRLKPGSYFGSPDYSREELVAELGAAVICQQHGMEKNLKDESASYLKSWLDNLNESPEFIRTILSDVKKATSMVENKIEEAQKMVESEPMHLSSTEKTDEAPDIMSENTMVYQMIGSRCVNLSSIAQSIDNQLSIFGNAIINTRDAGILQVKRGEGDTYIAEKYHQNQLTNRYTELPAVETASLMASLSGTYEHNLFVEDDEVTKSKCYLREEDGYYSIDKLIGELRQNLSLTGIVDYTPARQDVDWTFEVKKSPERGYVTVLREGGKETVSNRASIAEAAATLRHLSMIEQQKKEDLSRTEENTEEVTQSPCRRI